MGEADPSLEEYIACFERRNGGPPPQRIRDLMDKLHKDERAVIQLRDMIYREIVRWTEKKGLR